MTERSRERSSSIRLDEPLGSTSTPLSSTWLDRYAPSLDVASRFIDAKGSRAKKGSSSVEVGFDSTDAGASSMNSFSQSDAAEGVEDRVERMNDEKLFHWSKRASVDFVSSDTGPSLDTSRPNSAKSSPPSPSSPNPRPRRSFSAMLAGPPPSSLPSPPPCSSSPLPPPSLSPSCLACDGKVVCGPVVERPIGCRKSSLCIASRSPSTPAGDATPASLPTSLLSGLPGEAVRGTSGRSSTSPLGPPGGRSDFSSWGGEAVPMEMSRSSSSLLLPDCRGPWAAAFCPSRGVAVGKGWEMVSAISSSRISTASLCSRYWWWWWERMLTRTVWNSEAALSVKLSKAFW